jgi:hypothetical protein
MLLLGFTLGITAQWYKPTPHYYDTTALGNLTAAYAPIKPLDIADCIDCGSVE